MTKIFNHSEVSKANAQSQQGCTVVNTKKSFDDFMRENGGHIDLDRVYRFNSDEWDFNGMFHHYLHNREHNQHHIDEMANAIEESGGMENFPPLIINIRTNTFCNGHGRHAAITKVLERGRVKCLDYRVIFVDIPEDEQDDFIITLNTTSDNWSVNDYVKNFASRGIESYINLISFCLANEMLYKVKAGKKVFCPRYGIAALGMSNSVLKSGNLVLTDEVLDKGKKVVDEATELRSIIVGTDAKANGGGWLEAFLQGWNVSRETLDVDFKAYKKTLRNKMNLKKTNVPRGSNRKGDWIAFFDMINQETKRALLASKAFQ